MRRTVAIGLGIACVILLVGLVGVILFYSAIINDKNSMINDKNSQISDLNQQVSSLSSHVGNLSSIVNLAKSIIWINFENVSISAGYENVWNATADYAGYVSVQIFSSTADNIYVRLTYHSYGVNYDNQINVGTGGTAVFPVLPAAIQMSIGNPSMTDATMMVSIIYYY